jgi:hypothetical protein
MTMTTNTNSNNADHSPELDLDLIRPDLEQLAKDTVDKTLKQARASGIDPVLGSSSALAFRKIKKRIKLAKEKCWIRC